MKLPLFCKPNKNGVCRFCERENREPRDKCVGSILMKLQKKKKYKDAMSKNEKRSVQSQSGQKKKNCGCGKNLSPMDALRKQASYDLHSDELQ